MARQILPARRTPEDQAIFDRMDSMTPEFIYEDADAADAERMLTYMQARARFDLASAASRIVL
jgi:hypothetical protein